MQDYMRIETERTYLNVLTLNYTDDILKHFSDYDITKFMDIEPCKDRKDAEEIISYHINDKGCRWAIHDRTNGQFIGTCGFHYIRTESNKTIAEIGFDLAKSHWGKGFMKETVESLVHYGFSEAGFTMIDATVEPNNHRSVRLLEKIGFCRHEEPVEDLIYFTIKKTTFRKKVQSALSDCTFLFIHLLIS